MRNPTTIRDLAQTFGLITDGSAEVTLREELGSLLTLLAKDVSDDQDIHDGHARFFEHVTVVTLFGDSAEERQARIDGIGFTQSAEANAVERESIAWIRATWLK